MNTQAQAQAQLKEFGFYDVDELSQPEEGVIILEKKDTEGRYIRASIGKEIYHYGTNISIIFIHQLADDSIPTMFKSVRWEDKSDLSLDLVISGYDSFIKNEIFKRDAYKIENMISFDRGVFSTHIGTDYLSGQQVLQKLQEVIALEEMYTKYIALSKAQLIPLAEQYMQKMKGCN